MRTNLKLVGVAAILATVSGGAIAQSGSTTALPESAQSSQAAQAGEVTTAEKFETDSARAESNDSLSTQAGDTGAASVESTIADGQVPTSFDDSSVAEATDFAEMQDRSALSIMTMAQTQNVVAWEDEAAVDMRAAIAANTMVKSELEAAGYSEMDVVGAYTRADGGLTIIVDG
ncbi:hypothetical protein [Pseudooceanicola sp.]|uniref:hypothetical protein n=1 Tax=Pseudooceanicola sp. TaxID=1914328 RepID=UPI00405863C0